MSETYALGVKKLFLTIGIPSHSSLVHSTNMYSRSLRVFHLSERFCPQGFG